MSVRCPRCGRAVKKFRYLKRKSLLRRGRHVSEGKLYICKCGARFVGR